MSSVNSTLQQINRKNSISRLGLWLFFASDAFMFGGLLVSRILSFRKSKTRVKSNFRSYRDISFIDQ